MTQSNDSLPSLDELQQQIDKLKPESKEEQQDTKDAAGFGQAIKVVTELAAGVGVGAAVGYYLDRSFDTSPFLMFLFFLLGFAAAIRNIIRYK